MKVVLDTNVILSGLLWAGSTKTLFDFAKTGRLTICITPDIFDEVERVLSYPQMVKRLKILDLPPEVVLDYLLKDALQVEDVPRARAVTDDLSDNMFLDCAEQSGARWIISGDRHLLRLKSYGNARIVTPAVFLSLLH